MKRTAEMNILIIAGYATVFLIVGFIGGIAASVGFIIFIAMFGFMYDKLPLSGKVTSLCSLVMVAGWSCGVMWNHRYGITSEFVVAWATLSLLVFNAAMLSKWYMIKAS